MKPMRSVLTFLVFMACVIGDGSSNAEEPSPVCTPSSTPQVTAVPETTAEPNLPRDSSPDKKWEYVRGDEPKLVKAGTDQMAVDLSDCLRGGPLWAPDSKRFALNCSQGPRYQDSSLYQLRGGEWKSLKSPNDGVGGILKKNIAAQVKKQGLPSKTDLRLIWETFEVRRWVDSNTAILYASLHQVVRENPETRFDVEFFFTLKFDADGAWKVVKSHPLSDEEIEKEQ
jgi:hypothetical protein